MLFDPPNDIKNYEKNKICIKNSKNRGDIKDDVSISGEVIPKEEMFKRFLSN